MVIGMATRKVTITLDEAQLDQIRSLVQAGTAASGSGFIQHAVAVAVDDVAGWGAMLAEALRATGGELSDEERAWADEVLGTGTQPAAWRIELPWVLMLVGTRRRGTAMAPNTGSGAAC